MFCVCFRATAPHAWANQQVWKQQVWKQNFGPCFALSAPPAGVCASKLFFADPYTPSFLIHFDELLACVVHAA